MAAIRVSGPGVVDHLLDLDRPATCCGLLLAAQVRPATVEGRVCKSCAAVAARQPNRVGLDVLRGEAYRLGVAVEQDHTTIPEAQQRLHVVLARLGLARHPDASGTITEAFAAGVRQARGARA